MESQAPTGSAGDPGARQGHAVLVCSQATAKQQGAGRGGVLRREKNALQGKAARVHIHANQVPSGSVSFRQRHYRSHINFRRPVSMKRHLLPFSCQPASCMFAKRSQSILGVVWDILIAAFSCVGIPCSADVWESSKHPNMSKALVRNGHRQPVDSRLAARLRIAGAFQSVL